MGSITPMQTATALLESHAEPACMTLDQVIRKRAKTHATKALISYPQNEVDFVDYTGADLDRITRQVAWRYAEELPLIQKRQLVSGTGERHTEDRGPGSSDPSSYPNVVALVGISSLEYYITFLALQRLGITTMFVSPRLADQGHSHLLNTAGCAVAIASGPSIDNLKRIRKANRLDTDLSIIPMIDEIFIQNRRDQNLYGGLEDLPNLGFRNNDDGPGFIIHSGGTTGLPKPVPLKASAWLLQAADIVRRIPRADTLSTLPLFHSFGLATLLRGLVNGTRLSILNAARPVTAGIIRGGLDATQSQALVTVPYILKFFTETDGPGGVERLAQLRQVIAAGSAIPDELGDKIVAAGANIMHFYGQTESGALMEPPKDRLLWSWVTPLPHAAPYLKFEPVEDGDGELFHLVVLPGLKQKVFSDRPDGSYGTKDLFQRHPTEEGLWKFAARKDDMIVLVNGEKADPIPLEEAVTASPNVKAAVAFGAGQDILGLVVVRSDRATSLSHEDFVNSIRAELEAGNSRVPAYARVPSEMLVVKDADTQYPTTDKSTIIRSLFLKMFKQDIENAYVAKEQLDVANQQRGPLSAVQLSETVFRIVKEVLAPRLVDVEISEESDFFDLGMDSLQATLIRSRLLREIDIAGQVLATNVVFDRPNIRLLSEHLLLLRSGGRDEVAGKAVEDLARSLVAKYSQFGPLKPSISRGCPDAESIVSYGFPLRPLSRVMLDYTYWTRLIREPCCYLQLLTGSTGQVGAHVLSKLIRRDNVEKVHCLVRARTAEAGRTRIEAALRNAHILDELRSSELEKVVALPCDLGDPSGRLGLQPATYLSLCESVTSIIHNAWSVNFNMSLSSFESQCIRPTFDLINMALSSPLVQKPTFTFVSSIASVLQAGADLDGRVSETRHGWNSVAPMGYGQSKWVAEEMCANASEKAGLTTRVLRVGQVAGDTTHGIWKAAEAIPTMVQTALTIGALPTIEPSDSDHCYWLPVDIAAAATVEIGLLGRLGGPDLQAAKQSGCSIYHVVNPTPVKWNTQILAAVEASLKAYGVNFRVLPQREWLQRLEGSDKDVERNPPMKLLEFYRSRYGSLEVIPEPVLDVTQASQRSPSLTLEKALIDGEMIGKFVKYWAEQCWDLQSSAKEQLGI